MTVLAGGDTEPRVLAGTRCRGDGCRLRAQRWSWDGPYCHDCLDEVDLCPVCDTQFVRSVIRSHVGAVHPEVVRRD